MKTIKQFGEEIRGRMSNECHYIVMNYIDELDRDNTKLRTKVEANIPVERIKGLQAMVTSGFEIGLEATRTFSELAKIPSGLTSGVPREKKIVSVGYLEKNVPSIEDHEALKKQVIKQHQDLKAVVREAKELKEQVSELSKRPLVINETGHFDREAFIKLDKAVMEPGPGPQAGQHREDALQYGLDIGSKSNK